MKIAICGPVSTDAFRPYLEARADGPRGLGGTAVNLLVRELLRRGHPLLVVTCDPGIAPGEEVVLESDAVRIRYGPYRTNHRARDAFRVERKFLTDALRAEGPDIVHAHWTYEFALGALASGRPTLITCRDWAPAILRHSPDPYRAVRLGMQWAAFAKGKHFTAVSPYIQRRVASLVRRPVDLVPNGIEDTAFRFSRRELQKPPTFVSINAGFGRRKNVDTLLHAFTLLRTKRPDIRLVLVGPGFERGGVAAAWASQRAMHHGVEFHGAVSHPEVARILAGADVLVHPSREESFGNVLIEAMAQRIPVVGGLNSGAVPWVLDEGRAGLLADVTSAEELSVAMESILDPQCWLKYSTEGHTRAWETYRMQGVTDLYKRCYARVLEGDAA